MSLLNNSLSLWLRELFLAILPFYLPLSWRKLPTAEPSEDGSPTAPKHCPLPCRERVAAKPSGEGSHGAKAPAFIVALFHITHHHSHHNTRYLIHSFFLIPFSSFLISHFSFLISHFSFLFSPTPYLLQTC